MYEIGRYAADFIVQAALDEARRLEWTAKHKDLRGPEHVADRRRLRSRAHDLHCVIAGLNTGDGVTRASAAAELAR